MVECVGCNYTGENWNVDVTRSYEGTIDSAGDVHADGNDYQQETIVKCPECGEWNEELSAEITEAD